MTAYPGRDAFTSDSNAQERKRVAPHHMVACFDDACVHWVPADNRFHWYHTSCGSDVASGTDYRTAVVRLTEHMDSCDGSPAKAKVVPDPEVIHDAL